MKATPSGLISAAAFAFLPFVTLGQVFYGSINAKFFLVVALVDVLLLILAAKLWRERRWVVGGRWLLGALAITLLVQIAAAVAGIFPERSFWSDIFWSSGVIYFTHIALGAWAFSELLTKHDWSLVRRSIIFAAGVFALLSLIGTAGFGLEGSFLGVDLGRTGLSFGNETYAGIYLLLAFIVGLIEVFQTKGKMRMAAAASLVLIALSPLMFNVGILLGRTAVGDVLANPAHLLGLARASSAALFFVLAFLAGHILAKRFAPRVADIASVVWGSFLTIAAALGIALLLTPGSVVQNAYIQESTAARIIVWEAGVEAIAQRPLLGWGPENFDQALMRNFDPRLFLEENLGEIWFDRAHNVFIDTLVSTGYLGLVSFTALSGVYLLVVYRARRREQIGDTEAALLAILIPAHLLQLQTGFDTVSSYALLAVVGGYVLSLERGTGSAGELSQSVRKVAASALVLVVAGSAFTIGIGEYTRQAALLDTFRVRTIEAQQANIELSLSRVSSFESLRLSSASFLKGSLTLLADESTAERRQRVLLMAQRYEEHYLRFLAVQPDHYRAHVNYAYLLLVMTTLGEERITEAKVHIDRAHELSPGHPLTYILDALTELYGGNLAESRRLMQEAEAINPDIEFVAEGRAYFERQWKAFPNITVLQLTNL